MTSVAPTLLIVDDDPGVLRALERTLRTEKCRILAARSASEALSLIAAEPVDMLLTDVTMPDMSGLDLVSAVRANAPHVFRMVLTGNGTVETAMRAINEGEVHRFLAKPWDPGDLRRTVREAGERALQARKERHGASESRPDEPPTVRTHVLDEARLRTVLAHHLDPRCACLADLFA